MPTRRRIIRRIVIGFLILYIVGLGWGYVRLPTSAVKQLSDYSLATDGAMYVAADADISRGQRWWLERSLTSASTPSASRTSRFRASVKWNAVAVARVHSGHFTTFASTGVGSAEGKDALYVNVFGAWLRVWTFGHWIT